MNRPYARTAPALLREIADRYPDTDFVIDCGYHHTYAAFSDQVDAHALELAALGMQEGDRVGILMGNRVEWLLAYFAAMQLGAEVVALNTWLTAWELEYQLKHSRVKMLIAEADFLGRGWRALISGLQGPSGTDLPALKTLFWVDCAPDGSGDGLRSALRETPPEGTASQVDPSLQRTPRTALSAARPDATACILYTSGSTARAKGVPLLHSGMVANMWAIGERMHLQPGDRLWVGVSLFWSFACVNAVFTALTHGATLVLQHHFHAADALRLMDCERCTVIYATPNMLRALHDHPDRENADLRSLRTGATIGTPEQVRLAVDLGATQICNVYGLTEAYGNSSVTDASQPLQSRLTSQGPALEGVEIRVVDPQSHTPLPVGETGEIQIRGNLTPGYLDDPERTAESFSDEGYFNTGDLGRLDDSGNLQYRGRLKEMVKTNGINVAPAEVEEVLGTHPAVESVFVIGLPDAAADEILAAVIVPHANVTPDYTDLKTHCREYLAAYKVPRVFTLVDASALPQTSTGKLQRNRLGELFGQPGTLTV